jgi:hypothetical protein
VKDDGAKRPPEELLYDSEATLRLVDQAIEELSALDTEPDCLEHPQKPAQASDDKK